jgi:aminoglycoside phosphotransferase
MNEQELRLVWPELRDWTAVGMNESVFRVRTPSGQMAFLRPDDDSGSLLKRLREQAIVPVPLVIASAHGWLLLEGLAGTPLHEAAWIERPAEAAAIVAQAHLALEAAEVTHGDLCLPNILGDLASGSLSGIIDWRYANRFGREVDIAGAIWSCRLNGRYGIEMAVAVLEQIQWPRADPPEVDRLCEVWASLSE